MKTLILALIFVIPIPAFGQGTTYVNPYMRSNGTYVNGYYRTMPDSTRLNNWSTQGNVNPFTGSKGYQSPYSYPSNNLYQMKPTYPSYNNDYLYNH